MEIYRGDTYIKDYSLNDGDILHTLQSIDLPDEELNDVYTVHGIICSSNKISKTHLNCINSVKNLFRNRLLLNIDVTNDYLIHIEISGSLLDIITFSSVCNFNNLGVELDRQLLRERDVIDALLNNDMNREDLEGCIVNSCGMSLIKENNCIGTFSELARTLTTINQSKRYSLLDSTYQSIYGVGVETIRNAGKKNGKLTLENIDNTLIGNILEKVRRLK